MLPTSSYNGFVDIELPIHTTKLVGKVGVFEGVTGPKKKPIIHYGLPENQTMIVALWSFIQLPFLVQMSLIDKYTKAEGAR